MIKPLRSDIRLGSYKNGLFSVVDLRYVPRNTPRSSHGDIYYLSDFKKDPTLYINRVIQLFDRDGFVAFNGTSSYSMDRIAPVVVPTDVMRYFGPQYFGWTDREILEMFEEAQQTDEMHSFPQDDLPRAKRLWAEYVRTGVKISDVARMDAKLTEPTIAAEGNYADALTNY